MARLIRWDPFQELRQMMNTPFDYEWEEYSGMNLALDVSEDADNVFIEADLPGIDPDNVDITVTADQVTIKANREEAQEEKGKNYLRRERRYGHVSRTVALPTPIQSDAVEAEFDNGKLLLTLPKQEDVRPKQVKVSAKKKED